MCEVEWGKTVDPPSFTVERYKNIVANLFVPFCTVGSCPSYPPSLKKSARRRVNRRRAADCFRASEAYFMCLLTSLVISNMLTAFLPPKTAARFASGLIILLFFAS